MICIEKEQVTDTRWRVDLQADTDEKDPVNGADVDDLRNDIEFYAGSTLTILSPYTFKILGEDGVWHIKDTSGGGGGGGGTDNYNALSNKPQINGVTLSGNKSSADLNIPTMTVINEISADVTNLKTTVSGFEVIDEIKSGDMRPITSNAVHVGVGNIEAILQTL